MAVPLTLSSVPAQTPYVQYIATAGQTLFPYPFEITQDSDLVVLLNGVAQFTDSGYTLTGQGTTGGGNVVFTVGLTAGIIVTLYRNISIARITQLSQNGTFFSANFNNEYNRIYLILQQLQQSLGGATANSNIALTVPNSNSPAPIALLTPAAYANKYLSFDGNGNPEPALLTSSGSLTASIINSLLNSASMATISPYLSPYIRSAAEIAASVTPTSYLYPVGDPRRYGAVLDGVIDDTAALTTWASIGGALTFPGGLTALISAAIVLGSNTMVSGGKGSVIQTATHDISMFAATSQSNIAVRGMHFKMTSVGGATNVGGISLVGCSDCMVEGNEFEGMQFAGIFASAVTRCTFRANYCHDCLGTGQDSADIYIEASATTTSSYNVVDGNFCYGPTFEFGVVVWDPYSGVLPLHNVVTNNRVKAHNGYGILIYMPDIGDTYTQVIGNHVQDISAHSTNTSSGAGIYLAGAGLGGTVVVGNTVNNCCITTTAASLAPAGIGVNCSGAAAGGVPITIQGNVIEGMTQYHGILLTGCLSGGSVTGNTIRMPTQTGTVGNAIGVTNCNNVTVQGNIVTLLSTTTNGNGIVFAALGAACTNCAAIGNTVNGGHTNQLATTQSGGNQVQNLVISGNLLSGGDNSCVSLNFVSASAVDAVVTGNTLRAGNATAISHASCTNIRYSNNYVNGTGTIILTTTGVCTGSFYDRSNFGAGIGAGISNGATGFLITQSGTAFPSAGIWAVGDHVVNSAPAAAGIPGWYCTTAGTSGTWKAEAVLAA